MEDIITCYKNLVEKSFKNAENNISKLTDEILNLDGMTGIKTRHFYNNLLSEQNIKY